MSHVVYPFYYYNNIDTFTTLNNCHSIFTVFHAYNPLIAAAVVFGFITMTGGKHEN